MALRNTSSLTTNTGHRFISVSRTAYKIHIHMPDDTICHRSVGHVRLGKKKALKKAIKLRNQIGYEAWGKHWSKLLKDPYLMTRLPHTLEPRIILKPKKLANGEEALMPCYLGTCRKYDQDGNLQFKSMVRSINKYGKLTAYLQCKRFILEHYKDDIEILKFMGRTDTIGLK